MGTFLPSAGQISLNDIYNCWATSSSPPSGTPAHDLNAYRGTPYYNPGAGGGIGGAPPPAGNFPTTNISIKGFYGTGPDA